MIIGIGVDLAEVARITKSVENESFLKRVFTATEISYSQSKKNSGESFAARFATKEAFFKAIGSGWIGDLHFTDVEVVNDELGKPNIVLHKEAERIAKEKGVKKCHLSLSHTKDLATAYLILEG